MRKATATNYYTREVYGSASEIINARQEISRGSGDYGVGWKFRTVNKEEFLKLVKDDETVNCIKTKSGKYIEIDKNNLNNFILE